MTDRPLGLQLAAVGQQATSAFHARLAPHGVHPRAYAVLVAVAAREAASEAPTQRQLSTALGLPPSRMVGLLDDLQDQSLLERIADDLDRRAYRVQLTDAGRELVHTLQSEGEQLDQAIREALGRAGVARLTGMLERVSAQLEQEGAPRRQIW